MRMDGKSSCDGPGVLILDGERSAAATKIYAPVATPFSLPALRIMLIGGILVITRKNPVHSRWR